MISNAEIAASILNFAGGALLSAEAVCVLWETRVQSGMEQYFEMSGEGAKKRQEVHQRARRKMSLALLGFALMAAGSGLDMAVKLGWI
jgi:hypothetical protein